MNRSNLVRSGLLASVLLYGAGPLTAQTQGLRWLSNYKDAVEEARRTGKPIFLEYRCEP